MDKQLATLNAALSSPQIFIESKQFAILNAILDSARVITEEVKKLPNTGKRNRNTLRKTYNRRPMNKQKRARVFMGIALLSAFSFSQIAKIETMPI